MCEHYLKDDCLWGDKCRFSHNPDALRAGTPATKEMNFSNLDAGSVERTISVPKDQLAFFVAEATRKLLVQASGISTVYWHAERPKVTIVGTALQVDSADQLIKRVITHCNWGISEAKVHALIECQPCKCMKLRLAPMTPALKQMEYSLNSGKTQVFIGSGIANDLVVKGPLISRAHCILELIPAKGALYVVDTSTNGLFLNGVRLPRNSSGKVVVFHGDELLFPEPRKAVSELEFGYLVNLETM